jgi:alanine dehydrogenase
MGEKSSVEDLVRSQEGFRNGVYIYKGVLTNEVLGKVFGLKFKDINLLLPGM